METGGGKLAPQPDGTLGVVPLPLAAIEATGAKLVEDYQEQAVIDLGKASVESVSKATGMVVSLLPDHDRILLKNATLDAGAALPPGVTAPSISAATASLYLVVLRSLPKPEWVEAIVCAGAKIVGYVPSNTYLVWAPLAGLKELQAKGGPVINVLPLAPAFKLLEPERLLGPDGFSKMLAQVVDDLSSEAVVEAIEKQALPDTFGRMLVGSVTFAWGELPNDAAQGLAWQLQVVSIEPAPQLEPSGERQALIVAGKIAGTSRPYTPDCNQSYYPWFDYQFPGGLPDIKLGIIDTGLDQGLIDAAHLHRDFLDPYGASRVLYNATYVTGTVAADCTGHGTLVAATMAASGGSQTGTQFGERCGCGVACPFNEQWQTCAAESGCFWADAGVAPRAKILSARVWDDIYDSDDWPQMPTRVESALYDFANRGTCCANLSANSNASTTYTSFCQLLDVKVRTALPYQNGPISIVVTAGNSNSGSTVVDPAPAKNVITVGASENYNPFYYQDDVLLCTNGSHRAANADSAYDIADFSLYNVADGRVKPDLVAPGTRALGAASTYANYPSPCWVRETCTPARFDQWQGAGGGIAWASGTSFAAPAATGAAGLVSQWYKNTFGGSLPSPAMVKAMLINAAEDVANYGSLRGTTSVGHITASTTAAKYQGWGKLDLRRAFPSSNGRYALDQTYVFTGTGEPSWSRSFTVEQNDKMVQITLVWTDQEATAPSGAPLINNLDLAVEAVGGGQYFAGNDLASDGTSRRVFGSPVLDARNNVERILFRPLEQGLLTFRVRVSPTRISGRAIPNGPGGVNQDFALFVQNAH